MRATATNSSSSEGESIVATTAAANGADAGAADNGSREATATSTQDVSTLTGVDRPGDC